MCYVFGYVVYCFSVIIGVCYSDCDVLVGFVVSVVSVIYVFVFSGEYVVDYLIDVYFIILCWLFLRIFMWCLMLLKWWLSVGFVVFCCLLMWVMVCCRLDSVVMS